jgi:hypothetical protein
MASEKDKITVGKCGQYSNACNERIASKFALHTTDIRTHYILNWNAFSTQCFSGVKLVDQDLIISPRPKLFTTVLRIGHSRPVALNLLHNYRPARIRIDIPSITRKTRIFMQIMSGSRTGHKTRPGSQT